MASNASNELWLSRSVPQVQKCYVDIQFQQRVMVIIFWSQVQNVMSTWSASKKLWLSCSVPQVQKCYVDRVPAASYGYHVLVTSVKCYVDMECKQKVMAITFCATSAKCYVNNNSWCLTSWNHDMIMRDVAVQGSGNFDHLGFFYVPLNLNTRASRIFPYGCDTIKDMNCFYAYFIFFYQ